MLDPARQRELVAAAPVGRLATLRSDGTPRLVPITYVLLDGVLWSAVDDVKPKRHRRLARLDDVRRDPRVALLVDHYDADWSRLWWVRVDGVAAVHEQRDGPAGRVGAALAAKYPPYAARPPAGALLEITPTAWAGWSAS